MRKADLRWVDLACMLGERGRGIGVQVSGGRVVMIELSKSCWVVGVD